MSQQKVHLLSDNISPSTLKKLSTQQLSGIAEEIRTKIIDFVSTNGGQLGSNLCSVELTIALYYVINSNKDKVIWDTGHQCYTQKIITGRMKKFNTMYTKGGIDAFTNRSESSFDHWDTGHSGIGISAGMGFAETNKNKFQRTYIVLGDGSLSSGLCLEGLNNLGHYKSNVTLILNDNQMFISKAIGGISKALLKKSTAKNFFQSLGIKYFGICDGHNISQIIKVIKKSNLIRGPKIIHLKTEKGKGFYMAEKEKEAFHRSGPFEKKTGLFKYSKYETYPTLSGKIITNLARTNSKIVSVCPAMMINSGLTQFQQEFPNRFYDVGIAEQHAITFSCGLALNGLHPFVSIPSSFLQRGFDQLVLDTALQKAPISIVVTNAGFDSHFGPSHHGLFDIAISRILPNFIVMAPATGSELNKMLNISKQLNQPSIIRVPDIRTNLNNINFKDNQIEIGKSRLVMNGKDLTIIGIGPILAEAVKAKKLLEIENINIKIIDARFVKPLDKKVIVREVKKKPIITLEEHSVCGGFGSAISECLNALNINHSIKQIGVPDKFIPQGSRKENLKILKMDCDGISKTVKNVLNKI
jgi:1-deoxy-D-xylulose-5-phosphate synthase